MLINKSDDMKNNIYAIVEKRTPSNLIRNMKKVMSIGAL